VWSHGYFEGRVEDECARAARASASFAVLRLHVASEAPPDSVESTVSGALRASDVLATYGPGELEVLLVDTTPDRATALAAIVVAALASAKIEARVGLACFPLDACAAGALIAKACDAVRPTSPMPGKPSGVYGASLPLVAASLERIARGTINVLVTGETGVGKELVAEWVHTLSPRSSKPLVRLNCAFLSETLLASELFGHERGAFTGADRAKTGILEAADGGTVFLDEVGELPMAIQPKVLRVLEDKVVVRVGGVKGRAVDVRFVAATNRDLECEIAEGRFRQDLYFRLNGFHVHIPPLRERSDEIPAIAQGLLEDVARNTGVNPAPILSREALDALIGYSWPGNVRELRNVIERAVLLCTTGAITAEHLPIDKMRQRIAQAPAPARSADPPHDPLRAALEARERQRVTGALAQCGGNQTHAARLLGMSRGTLLTRMNAYGLARPRKGR
jgi:two-component system response regulator AtoC